MFGPSYDVYPMFYAKLPSAALQIHLPVLSLIAVAALIALFINFIFTLRFQRNVR